MDDMFPARANASFIRDEEDAVYVFKLVLLNWCVWLTSLSDRCPSCGWELDEEGSCVHCNLHFRQAARTNDMSDSDRSDSSDESDSEMDSFIADDHAPVVFDDSSSELDSSSDEASSETNIRRRCALVLTLRQIVTNSPYFVLEE